MSRNRTSVGYYGGAHTVRERQWFAALVDTVGVKAAFDIADEVIRWRLGRPDEVTLNQWLNDYDDGKWLINEEIRQKVERRVARMSKSEHQQWLRKMMRVGSKIIAQAEETGKVAQPIAIKYIADGVNQGMMLHTSNPARESSSMTFGNLTINVGKPPKQLREPKKQEMIEPEFQRLLSGSD